MANKLLLQLIKIPNYQCIQKLSLTIKQLKHKIPTNLLQKIKNKVKTNIILEVILTCLKQLARTIPNKNNINPKNIKLNIHTYIHRSLSGITIESFLYRIGETSILFILIILQRSKINLKELSCNKVLHNCFSVSVK